MNDSRRVNRAVDALLASSALMMAFTYAGDAIAEECQLVGFQLTAGADQPLGTTAEQPQPPAEPDFVPGEILVKFRSPRALESFSTERVTLPALGEDLGLAQDTSEPTPPGVAVFRVETFSVMSADQLEARTEELINQLEQREDVEYAHPNYIFTTKAAAHNDPCYALQWHFWTNGESGDLVSPGGINLPEANAVTTGSRDVVVAVLDTGQDFEHSDLDLGNFVPGYDFVDNDEDPADPGRDTGWHGTHVSGTIGALATNNGVGAGSIDWQVGIQPVRVLGDGGSGDLLGIINAIHWSAGIPLSGIRENETPAKVINMSLGGLIRCADVRALQDAINAAHEAGTLVVAAAGNERVDVSRASPAGCDNVLTVAAGDVEGSLVMRYSNFGDGVEIMAPGGDVRADTNGDGHPDGVLSSVRGGFAFYNGTSMAAPHVAGAAALLAAYSPEMGPTELQRAIMENALPRDASQCPRACGAGLLNAAALFGDSPPPQRQEAVATAGTGAGRAAATAQVFGTAAQQSSSRGAGPAAEETQVATAGQASSARGTGPAAEETQQVDEEGIHELLPREGVGAEALTGTGFTYRHDWGDRNGQWILNLNWSAINADSRVFVAIGECAAGGGKFIGGARYTLHNVAPSNGAVGTWVNIEWSSPIRLCTDYLVVNP